jgi:hypothetical protein
MKSEENKSSKNDEKSQPKVLKKSDINLSKSAKKEERYGRSLSPDAASKKKGKKSVRFFDEDIKD